MRVGAGSGFTERVHDVVRRIPKGKVATYGDVARLAGAPAASRYVGFALRRGDKLPWWRVVAAKGRIAIREEDSMREQRRRLKVEHVAFTRDGNVRMDEHHWRP